MHRPRTRFTFSLTFIMLLATTSYSEEPKSVEWVTGYGTARTLSAQSNRPVLLFMTTDHCVHCNRMKTSTLNDLSVQRSLRKDFVPAMINGNENKMLAEKLRITLYPTTVIIAPDGRILEYIRGYVPTEDLRAKLAAATTQLSQIASTQTR
ncbi:MAG: thioredoxin family protein [Pirellulaceae bacterium]|nr:thioredoxin family protein [Planctomycetales bacterium]